MKAYWKDLKNAKEEWGGLEVNLVHSSQNSLLQLFSGGNRRLRLDIDNIPILYAAFDKHRQECWALFTYNEFPDLVDKITSQDIEDCRSSEMSYEQFWARYFAAKLFSQGNQLIDHDVLQLKFMNDGQTPFQNWKWERTIYNTIECFTPESFLTIDWLEYSNSWGLLSLKNPVDIDNGRLKWWRKNAKQGLVPPILTFFVPTLDSYIILDGHVRMQACLLENVPAPLIHVSAVNYEHIVQTDEGRRQIYERIEKRNQHPWKTPLSVKAMNEMATLAGDRSFSRSITKAKGLDRAFEEKWKREVLSIADEKIQEKTDFKSFMLGRIKAAPPSQG